MGGGGQEWSSCSIYFVQDCGLQCHAIQNKNRNRSIYERWLIYKKPRLDLDLCGDAFVRYLEKCFAHIYRALYGYAKLMPANMGTNMVAVK